MNAVPKQSPLQSLSEFGTCVLNPQFPSCSPFKIFSGQETRHPLETSAGTRTCARNLISKNDILISKYQKMILFLY